MHKHWAHTIVLTAVASSLFSCASANKETPQSPASGSAPPDAAAEVAEFDAAVVAPRADCFKPQPLKSGDSRTEKEGFITARGENRRYRVYFGGPTEADEGKITYLNADPQVQVNQGFGMAWGWRPFITTDRITTATDGTKVLAQIDGAVHRIYLLSGGMVEVTPRYSDLDECGAPAPRVLDEPWTYFDCVEVDRDNDGKKCVDIVGPKDLATADPAIRQFIRDVLKRQRVKALTDD